MITFKHQANPSPSTESGFTVIESLIAIIVVSILMIALSPVIVLSVATRVQSKRVERATQAAQSYIDQLRGGTIVPVDADDPDIHPYVNNDTDDKLRVESPSASASLNCEANQYCTSPSANQGSPYNLYCVDGNNDGVCTDNNPQDLLIQAFGYSDSTTSDNEERAQEGYQLGIRVYRADAFSDSEPLKPTAEDLGKQESVTQSPVTGGLGDRKAPLLEITTEIVTEGTTYSDYCSRVGGC